MEYLKMYEDFYKKESILCEELGISNEVNYFSISIINEISKHINFVKKSFVDFEINISYFPFKNIFNYDNLIVEFDTNFSFQASNNIDAKTNTLILKFNMKYIPSEKELFGLILHEVQHLYTNIMGLKIKIDYNLAVNIKRECMIDTYTPFPETVKLMEMIYYSSPTEIYAHVHELWFQISFSKIKTKEDFNKYLLNNGIYQYTTRLGKHDIYKIWDDIKKEEMCDILIDKFKVKNIDKWLKYLDKQFKESGESYLYRFGRLLEKIQREK